MLYFTVPGYPDEIVGSLLLRACRHSGYAYKPLMRHLTGSRRCYFSMLLPADIPHIAKLARTSPETLLWEHTMFPYVVAFMTQQERSRLQAKILAPAVAGERLSSLTKSVSQGTHCRRFCAECVLADVDAYGEAYWHRTHLLPGSYWCVEHSTPLAETEIPLTGTGANVLTMPSEAKGSPARRSVRPEMLEQLARNNHLVLSGQTSVVLRYRAEALMRGYQRRSGIVASSLLVDNLRSAYGEAFLAESGCQIDKDSKGQWPAMLVRGEDRGPFPTIKHVLLTTFLGQDDSGNKTAGFGSARRKYDFSGKDRACVAALKKEVEKASVNKERLAVSELLSRAGYWSSFRHRLHCYPLTCDFVRAFRRSNLSARQTGGRPRNKAEREMREVEWSGFLRGENK